MANNLFVSYDLYAPGQNYEKVIEAIKSKGAWAKVQKSLWYLKTKVLLKLYGRSWTAMIA